jgi:hypothetical protein
MKEEEMANTKRTRNVERIWARQRQLDEDHRAGKHEDRFNADCSECRVAAYEEDMAEAGR